MTPRLILSFGLSALVLGGSMVGCTGTADHIATASDRNDAIAAKAARRDAGKAARALARRDLATAVPLAESAVQFAPRDAGYRMLLGQSYLQAGRFVSARDSFADVLALTPDNGKAALNLALAQVATGDWAAARATLDAHAATIPVGDLGLATALAGNPNGAIQLLNAAARSPGAGAKVRQNLALSYALAGQWNMARVAAAADISPADLDARMEQWASFAQPKGASDQVATLLGVQPVADAGRPVALALNGSVPVTPQQDAAVQMAAVSPAAPAPQVPAATDPAPTALAMAAAEPPAAVRFAPFKEVAQPLPTMLARTNVGPATIRAEAAPLKVAAAKPLSSHVVQTVPAATPFVRVATGDWYVQLGAFSNVAIAKSGWASATRRFTGLADHQPSSTRIAARQGELYRLSVGGFTRAQADQMCRAYRDKGGACFVRQEAGDRMAQWLKTPMQVASR